MRAMILAAGLGTRLKPLTDLTPKALIKIKNFTLLELQIRKLAAAGFNKIVVNVHHHSEMVKDFLEQNTFAGCEIIISDEKDKLLDTGGGLKKASWFFSDGEPFLVHNVDVLSDIKLDDFYNYHIKSAAIASLAVQQRPSSRYFLVDEKNQLVGWENEKTGKSKVVIEQKGKLRKLAFSGIQIIDPKIFRYFPGAAVFSLVDLYLSAAVKEKIYAFNHSKDRWLDMGKMENLREAESFL
jgi:NDP-sugar pyrophosphorylase family protein